MAPREWRDNMHMFVGKCPLHLYYEMLYWDTALHKITLPSGRWRVTHFQYGIMSYTWPGGVKGPVTVMLQQGVRGTYLLQSRA